MNQFNFDDVYECISSVSVYQYTVTLHLLITMNTCKQIITEVSKLETINIITIELCTYT